MTKQSIKAPGPLGFFLFCFFSILLWIYFVFGNMGPYGSENFKTQLLPQITFESFQTFSEISSQLSSQKYCFGFLTFWVLDFSFFFVFVKLNMGPYGRQNFKTLLLPQITFESFQTFSEFSSYWSSQKYCFEFLKFWVFEFSGFFFVFVNMHGTLWEPKCPYGKQIISIIWKTSDRGAKVSEIRALGMSVKCTGYFWHFSD